MPSRTLAPVTEFIMTRIIEEQNKGPLNKELERVLDNAAQSKLILDEMAFRRSAKQYHLLKRGDFIAKNTEEQYY